MIQYGLSENAFFCGFKCLFSPWKILRIFENQQENIDLRLVNEK